MFTISELFINHFLTLNNLFFIVGIIIFLVCYYTFLKRAQWISLLIASSILILFYDWRCFLIYIGFILITYLLARLIDSDNKKKSLTFLIIGLVLITGSLITLKLFNVIPVNFINVIGFSYLSFSTIAFLCDIYSKKCEAEKNIFRYALFVLYFPKIFEGPIEKYQSIKEQLFANNKSFDDDRFFSALSRYIIGLFKIVIISNVISIYITSIKNNLGTANGVLVLSTIFIYPLELYFNFSGFMDLALGTSSLLGVDLKENFNNPFLSTRVSEIWSRWHISLTSWLKEYIYIPLGGNRKGSFRTILNILAVWLVSALWHGLSVHFLLWGLYFAIVIIIEKFNKEKETNSKFVIVMRRIRTYVFFAIGFSLFNVANMSEYLDILKQLLSFSESFNIGFNYLLLLIPLCGIVLVYLFNYIDCFPSNNLVIVGKTITDNKLSLTINSLMIVIMLAAIILVSILLWGLGSTANEFAYFNF